MNQHKARKQDPAVARACEIVGSQSELGRQIGVGQSAVNYWLWSRKPVPAKRAVQIEVATGGKVRREEIRPDLFARGA